MQMYMILRLTVPFVDRNVARSAGNNLNLKSTYHAENQSLLNILVLYTLPLKNYTLSSISLQTLTLCSIKSCKNRTLSILAWVYYFLMGATQLTVPLLWENNCFLCACNFITHIRSSLCSVVWQVIYLLSIVSHVILDFNQFSFRGNVWENKRGKKNSR